MNSFDFHKKKVVIMGLGLHGGGRAAAQWFFEQGAEVIVTDRKTEEDLRESVIALNRSTRAYRLAHPKANLCSLRYTLGKHREEDFRAADLIIQNPAVPRESAYLAIAKEAGVPIENEVTLFFQLAPKSPKIAITGTRGKSTTAVLVHEMLKRQHPEALLIGVAGYDQSRPFLSVVDYLRQKESQGVVVPCIMELSSWQLELFSLHRCRPDIAVVTNVLQDHLNRYPDFEAYRDAKAALYAFQEDRDAVVFNYDNEHTRLFGIRGTPSRLYWFSLADKNISRGCVLDGSTIFFHDEGKKTELFRLPDKNVFGSHLIENMLAACTAARAFGVLPNQISDALSHFNGVPSRLERIGEKQGRIWYDDTTSTSPDATSAALRTLGSLHKKKIILIAGGADKNCDFSDVAKEIQSYCKAVVLLSGTATPKIAIALGLAHFKGSSELANSMREAVSRAWKFSEKDDIILLSPAAASFGMFANEFDRGAQFRKVFSSLYLYQ